MNCPEVAKNFADVLDGRVDPQRLRQIEDHLNVCARCSEELAGLAESHRLVRDLPPVEPPLGFTLRVMAEVRESAHSPTFWQRLFFFIPSKLPLQATAVVIISVLAAYLYQKESRHWEPSRTAPPASSFQTGEEPDRWPSSPAQPPAVEPKMELPDEAGAQGQREKRSSPAEQSRSLSEYEEQNKVIDGGRFGAAAMPPIQDHATPTTPSSPQPNEKFSAGDEAASARLEQSFSPGKPETKGAPLAGTLRENDTVLRDTPPAKSSAAGDRREQRAAASIDALGSSVTLFADYELTLRLKQPARDDKNPAALPQQEALLTEPQLSKSRAEFKDLEQARQRAMKTGEPQTVWTTIASGQYDGLKNELAGFGNIESEMPPPVPKNNDGSNRSKQLRIKLTILPPLPSAGPPSNR